MDRRCCKSVRLSAVWFIFAWILNSSLAITKDGELIMLVLALLYDLTFTIDLFWNLFSD